jgi:transcriptional regulator with XRE-family HTH domain
MLNTEIGDRLRLIRLYRKRTQEQVAQAIHADQAKISLLEHGLITLHYPDLLALAAVLHFSIDAFGQKDFDLMACVKKVP